jgi:hypothetical protein
MKQAREEAHRRGLPRPIGAQEAVDDAARDREVKAGKRDALAVALAKVARREREIWVGGDQGDTSSAWGTSRDTGILPPDRGFSVKAE